MGKLLAVIGNVGVGKTTLSLALHQHQGYNIALEEHATRPYQELFAAGLNQYAFLNQVDYLLFRGEQEATLRRSRGTGIIDGGLDLDFEVFTRYFYAKGFLQDPEFRLCERIYRLLRQLLPPPDLYLYLEAPQTVIAARLSRRKRPVEVAGIEAIPALEGFLQDWLDRLGGIPVFRIDAGVEGFGTASETRRLAVEIQKRLFPAV